MDPNKENPQEQNIPTSTNEQQNTPIVEAVEVTSSTPTSSTLTNPEVVPPQQVDAHKEEPIKKKSPILTIAVIVLLFAVLVFAGYFVWNKYFKTVQVIATPSPIAEVIPTATPDTTVNWNTYKNTNFGMEFKYPKEWALINDSYVSTSPSFNTGIKSSTKKNNQSNEDFVNYTFSFQKDSINNYNTWKAYDTTKTLGTKMISGLLFERYIISDMYLSFDYIYKTSTNEIYRFSIYPYEEGIIPESLVDTIDQVVSTFKFTEASSSSTIEQ